MEDEDEMGPSRRGVILSDDADRPHDIPPPAEDTGAVRIEDLGWLRYVSHFRGGGGLS